MIDDLVRISQELGDSAKGYAILAEGNTSARIDDELMLVKASGASLRDASHDTFLEVSIDAALALLDQTFEDEAEQMAALTACVVGNVGLSPSVETALHAVALRHGGARVVGHTHPTAVNAIVCSDHAADLTRPLFPDQIVVCGVRPLLLPYLDPGLPLARALRDALCERGAPSPKTVYLRNHGMIAFGQTAHEVLQITEMAVKAAAVLGGALATGKPLFLTENEAGMIDGRLDEHYRRAMLAQRGRPVDDVTLEA